jgi:hypothetical protein
VELIAKKIILTVISTVIAFILTQRGVLGLMPLQASLFFAQVWEQVW